MSLLPSKPDTSTVDDAEPRVIGVDSDDADDVISALSSETARKLLAELHEEPAPPSELSDRVDTSLQNAQYHLQKLESAGAVSVVDTAYSAKGREMDVYAPADQPLVIFAGDEERTTGLKAALARLLGGVGVLGVASLAIQSLFGGNDELTRQSLDGSGNGGNGGGPATGGNGNGAAGGAAGGNGNGAGGNAGDGGAMGGNGGVETSANVTDGGDGGSYSIAEVTDEETTTTTTEEAVTESADVAIDTTTTVVKTTTQAGEQLSDNATEAVDTAASAIPPGLLFFAGGTLVLALWLVVWYARE